MKGIVLTQFADMIEKVYGLDSWDSILSETGHSGLYLSIESYPDSILFDLVASAERVCGVPTNDLLRLFGTDTFSAFRQQNPELCPPEINLKEFLLTVDRVIHVEVRKLHPDASLPRFSYGQESDEQLTMYYASPRKLCMLAEGLIAGAAKYYQTRYSLTHEQCMHKGHDQCALHLTLESRVHSGNGS